MQSIAGHLFMLSVCFAGSLPGSTQFVQDRRISAVARLDSDAHRAIRQIAIDQRQSQCATACAAAAGRLPAVARGRERVVGPD